MNQFVLLAKSAVETYIKESEIISAPEDLPKEFLRKAGTFVSIFQSPHETDTKKELRGLPRSQAKLVLRGCIGTYLPTKENIAKEIIDNAIAAAAEDYRFGPIQEKELPSLSYTVYILNQPESVKNVSELNPKKYGIIIKTAPIISSNTDVVFNGHLPHKSGLLLPGLEGVDTAQKQISITCQKAGIDPTKEQILIYRFTVEKYK